LFLGEKVTDSKGFAVTVLEKKGDLALVKPEHL
jgi:hypothetical protein